MPFPVIKLGYLAVKQIAKPLANLLKQKAKSNLFLRNYLLVKPAQCKLYTERGGDRFCHNYI